MDKLKNIPVIFAGHGGIINGEYVTAPDKMYQFDDGFTIYEGEINRKVCKYLSLFLKDESIPHFYLDTELDTELRMKTQIAERLHSRQGNCFLLDIHHNGGGGTGSEVFTSPGDTPSDPIATDVFHGISGSLGKSWEMRDGRGDGDPDKEAKFYVLMNTYLPSLLVECGFMDYRADAEFIVTDEGQKAFAKGIANGILKHNGLKQIPKSRKNPKCE